ncbi:hypothetical protein QUB75_30065 [Microcoleus sp. K1-B6]|uniref:hypothetical protein n=1 Tax=unclassified Microcoleus TaxID=2642155 RepID=UPI002FD3BF3D
MKAVKLEIGVLRQEAGGRRQEAGGRRKEEEGKRKKEGARRSVFTNMRCSPPKSRTLALFFLLLQAMIDGWQLLRI